MARTVRVDDDGRRTGAGEPGLPGLGVLVSPLLAAGVLGFILGVAPPAAAVPLVIVLLPVVLGLGGLVLLASLFGVIPAAAAIGRLVTRRGSPPAAVLVGCFSSGSWS